MQLAWFAPDAVAQHASRLLHAESAVPDPAELQAAATATLRSSETMARVGVRMVRDPSRLDRA
jgi:hypothetical protein